MPPIVPQIDEYQLFRGHCSGCGISTTASLPEGVPTGQCGPRLAAFTGLLMGHFRQSDRAKMYLDGKRLQWCWAHLKRDFQKLIDSPNGTVRRMGHDLMRQHKILFEHWHHYQAEKLKWSTFQSYVRPIREEVRYLLLRGKFSGNAKLIGFCNASYDRREHLWTFTRVEGIEPTNNTAERALRPAVIYRKLSFGTQSASGSRYLERLLTVSETCRLQDRNAYHYLIEAMEAKFAGQPAPSLLPQPEPPDASAA